MNAIRNINRNIDRIKNDSSGNVSIFFAFALVILLVVTTVAIDFASYSNDRIDVQNGLDGALLSAIIADVDTNEEKQSLAKKIFLDTLADHIDKSAVTVAVSMPDNTTITASANFASKSLFGKYINNGMSTMTIRSTAVTDVTNSKVDVSLVLDITGSMAGNKLTALKQAATELLNSIEDGAQVRVAIVPFAHYVNVGLQNRNEPGLNIPADIPQKGEWRWENRYRNDNCRDEDYQVDIRQCSSTRRCETRYNDGVPYNHCWNENNCRVVGTETRTRRVCDRVFSHKEHVYRITQHAQTWQGCVGSSDEDWDEAYSAQDIPGFLNMTQCGNSPIVRLTDNMTTLHSTINNLNAQYETYIPAGLVWGWRTLANATPFADSFTLDDKNGDEKILVLMTDGKNTKSHSANGYHNGNSTHTANSRTKTLCTNIKEDGITIWTIAFQVHDTATKQMLEDCATEPAKNYIEARNNTELLDAFDQIARGLLSTRITK